MKNLLNQLRALSRDESGAAAVEYGLLASLIALAIVVSVTALGNDLNGIFTRITAAI